MITIINSPGLYDPIYNPIWYKVQSSNSSNQLFKYIYDFSVDGNIVFRSTNAPAPDGYGYIDVSRVIESYVTNDLSSSFTENGSPSVGLDNNYIEFKLVFGEQYYNGSTLTYSGLTTGTTIYPFAAALEYKDVPSYDWNDYNMSGSTDDLFLTHMPRTSYVTATQRQYLTFLRNAILTAVTGSFKVITYTSADITKYEYYININNNSLDNGGRMLRIPTGWYGWGQIDEMYVSGPDASSWSGRYSTDIVKWTICLCDENGNNTSEIFTYILKDDKCRYTPKEIYFKNRLGAVETFVFQLVSSKKQSSSKSNYQNNNPYNQIGYSNSDRVSTNLSITSKETFTALSDWITEEESEWLKELFTSNLVWIKEGTSLIPINILSNNYDIYTKEQKNLFNVAIEYEYTWIDDNYRG